MIRKDIQHVPISVKFSTWLIKTVYLKCIITKCNSVDEGSITLIIQNIRQRYTIVKIYHLD